MDVIGDVIDPLGKYIRKSHEAHQASERETVRPEEETTATVPDSTPSEEQVELTLQRPDVVSQIDIQPVALIVTLTEKYGG